MPQQQLIITVPDWNPASVSAAKLAEASEDLRFTTDVDTTFTVQGSGEVVALVLTIDADPDEFLDAQTDVVTQTVGDLGANGPVTVTGRNFHREIGTAHGTNVYADPEASSNQAGDDH